MSEAEAEIRIPAADLPNVLEQLIKRFLMLEDNFSMFGAEAQEAGSLERQCALDDYAEQRALAVLLRPLREQTPELFDSILLSSTEEYRTDVGDLRYRAVTDAAADGVPIRGAP